MFYRYEPIFLLDNRIFSVPSRFHPGRENRGTDFQVLSTKQLPDPTQKSEYPHLYLLPLHPFGLHNPQAFDNISSKDSVETVKVVRRVL